MAKNPLFSAYRQGENRVTSSMLAVFERIDLSLLEGLLTAATGDAGGIQMVSFVNQPAGEGASVPDARISASFAYWFEVKTTRAALRVDQLREHVRNLGKTGGDERLFVITPDASKPKCIDALCDNRVIWFDFKSLSSAIDEVLDDAKALLPEQTRFLLRELQALLIEEGLLDTADVVIVAARLAYPEYSQHNAYVCQPNRSFREGLTHLGFYTDSAIRPEVPRIRWREEAVPFTKTEADRRRGGNEFDKRIAELIDTLPRVSSRQEGSEYQVFLLSAPDSPDTVRLQAPIVNDQRSAAGQLVAWTMGQRYVSLEALRRPETRSTSDLDRS
jgi:hypothetical protein